MGYYKFAYHVRQIFLNSDTSVALLSGAPFDDKSWWLLPNEQIREAVDMINRVSGTRRMLGHVVITPGQAGWKDEVDKAIDKLRPDSWKAYTIGDPLSAKTKYPWRLDDEKLMYPFYEKAVKAGIRTICIHKGLMPTDYEKSWANVWQYNTAWDIGKAAKDWPQFNFIIYHGCLQAFQEIPDRALAEFEKTGEIKWATDLARIPALPLPQDRALALDQHHELQPVHPALLEHPPIGTNREVHQERAIPHVLAHRLLDDLRPLAFHGAAHRLSDPVGNAMQRKGEIPVEILVEAVVAAPLVAQDERRRLRLSPRGALATKLSQRGGERAALAERFEPAVGDRRQVAVAVHA